MDLDPNEPPAPLMPIEIAKLRDGGTENEARLIATLDAASRDHGDDKCAECRVLRRYHDMPEAGRDHPFRSPIYECEADETKVLAANLHHGILEGEVSVADLAKVLTLALTTTATTEAICTACGKPSDHNYHRKHGRSWDVPYHPFYANTSRDREAGRGVQLIPSSRVGGDSRTGPADPPLDDTPPTSRDSETLRGLLHDLDARADGGDDIARDLGDRLRKALTSRDSEVREAIERIVDIVKRHTHQGLYAMTRFAGPDPEHDCGLCRALVAAGVLTLDQIGVSTRAAILDHASEAAPTEEPDYPTPEQRARLDAVELAPEWLSRAVTGATEHVSGLFRPNAAGLFADALWTLIKPYDPASEAAPVVELSEAWAKAEAALPEGVELFLSKDVLNPPERRYEVEASARILTEPPPPADWTFSADFQALIAHGATPTEALLNLAVRLTQTRTLGNG